MGIMDEVTSRLGGQQQGSDNKTTSLLGGVMEMFSDPQSGGLQGLVQSFQQKGLGGIVSSWVGTGQNQAISPDQIREGLGSERLQNLADKAGIPQEEVTSKLSEHLPGFVDKLTPNGSVPEEGGMLSKAMDMLKGR
ncbi:YidB family protein [Pelotalea chapellei]|uniref:DUF937 domain-containing protein n=1 Tax=Pelotalea chapellei TaxID=44671 RepID=A0ABS5UB40_9BACT|nr:YidB family protein [Pelotalea chapellei]MBT1072897.1 DUF937 domain-containing protein [Pelotalea chapellei]